MTARRLHPPEAQGARGLGRGGGEKPDAEVKVVADSQPPAAERRHPAPHVDGDAGPRLGVGLKQRVGPAAVGGDEPGLPAVEQHVERVRAGAGQPEASAPAAEVDASAS